MSDSTHSVACRFVSTCPRPGVLSGLSARGYFPVLSGACLFREHAWSGPEFPVRCGQGQSRAPTRTLSSVRKACSRSRMCCSHYTTPLGTPVTPGDMTGHAVSWSQVSMRPPLIIRMVSVLPLVLALSTQPLGSQGKVIGVSEERSTEHNPTCLKSGDSAIRPWLR